MKKGDAYNKEGREIIASIERENYIIDIVSQDEAENTIDDLYQVLAKLMYKQELEKQMKEENDERK